MFGFDPASTVYGRVGALAGGDRMASFALDALREAYFSPEAEGRLTLVTYDTLTAAPSRALDAIYVFWAYPSFAHDVEAVSNEADELTAGSAAWACTGSPGDGEGRARDDPAPGLFSRFSGDTFWRNRANPRRVRSV